MLFQLSVIKYKKIDSLIIKTCFHIIYMLPKSTAIGIEKAECGIQHIQVKIQVCPGLGLPFAAGNWGLRVATLGG